MFFYLFVCQWPCCNETWWKEKQADTYYAFFFTYWKNHVFSLCFGLHHLLREIYGSLTAQFDTVFYLLTCSFWCLVLSRWTTVLEHLNQKCKVAGQNIKTQVAIHLCRVVMNCKLSHNLLWFVTLSKMFHVKQSPLLMSFWDYADLILKAEYGENQQHPLLIN